MVKVCTQCKVEKYFNEFYKERQGKNGLRSKCKFCMKKNKNQWRKDNKEKSNEQIRKRRKIDHLYKLKENLRGRTYKAFKKKGYSKNTKTQDMLGVDWEVAKQYIERQFKKGMNWENQGEWHIDHIIPLASAKTPERLKKLCHYTNLQPMWAVDNLSKSDSINGQQTLLRI